MLRGYTQPQIAEMIGVALRTYQCYEQGTRNPPLDLLVIICKTLDVTSDYLLGISDEAPADER